MLKDTPYSVLKQNGRAYEIMLLRDRHNNTFAAIGETLHMTRAKARHIYEMFYHAKAMALIRALQEKAGSDRERAAILDRWLDQYKSPKERCDMLMKEFRRSDFQEG